MWLLFHKTFYFFILHMFVCKDVCVCWHQCVVGDTVNIKRSFPSSTYIEHVIKHDIITCKTEAHLF